MVPNQRTMQAAPDAAERTRREIFRNCGYADAREGEQPDNVGMGRQKRTGKEEHKGIVSLTRKREREVAVQWTRKNRDY